MHREHLAHHTRSTMALGGQRCVKMKDAMVADATIVQPQPLSPSHSLSLSLSLHSPPPSHSFLLPTPHAMSTNARSSIPFSSTAAATRSNRRARLPLLTILTLTLALTLPLLSPLLVSASPLPSAPLTRTHADSQLSTDAASVWSGPLPSVDARAWLWRTQEEGEGEGGTDPPPETETPPDGEGGEGDEEGSEPDTPSSSSSSTGDDSSSSSSSSAASSSSSTGADADLPATTQIRLRVNLTLELDWATIRDAVTPFANTLASDLAAACNFPIDRLQVDSASLVPQGDLTYASTSRRRRLLQLAGSSAEVVASTHVGVQLRVQPSVDPSAPRPEAFQSELQRQFDAGRPSGEALWTGTHSKLIRAVTFAKDTLVLCEPTEEGGAQQYLESCPGSSSSTGDSSSSSTGGSIGAPPSSSSSRTLLGLPFWGGIGLIVGVGLVLLSLLGLLAYCTFAYRRGESEFAKRMRSDKAARAAALERAKVRQKQKEEEERDKALRKELRAIAKGQLPSTAAAAATRGKFQSSRRASNGHALSDANHPYPHPHLIDLEEDDGVNAQARLSLDASSPRRGAASPRRPAIELPEIRPEFEAALFVPQHLRKAAAIVSARVAGHEAPDAFEAQPADHLPLQVEEEQEDGAAYADAEHAPQQSEYDELSPPSQWDEHAAATDPRSRLSPGRAPHPATSMTHPHGGFAMPSVSQRMEQYQRAKEREQQALAEHMRAQVEAHMAPPAVQRAGSYGSSSRAGAAGANLNGYSLGHPAFAPPARLPHGASMPPVRVHMHSQQPVQAYGYLHAHAPVPQRLPQQRRNMPAYY